MLLMIENATVIMISTQDSGYVKHIEGNIWELRPEFGGVEMRLFYFIWTGDLIVFLHGFKKKSQKTPSRELAVAKRRMESLL